MKSLPSSTAFAAVCCSAFAAGLSFVSFGARSTEGDTLTIDNEIMTIAKEADFGDGIAKIVLR